MKKCHRDISPAREQESSPTGGGDGGNSVRDSTILSSTKLEVTEQLYSCSMFMQAANSGNKTLLEDCLQAGISLETKANDGSTALHCAARAGQTAAVQFLLMEGADTEAVNENRRIPLHEAILSKIPDTFSAMLHFTAITAYQQSIENYLLQSGSAEVRQLYIEQLGNPFTCCSKEELLAISSKLGQTLTVARLIHQPDIDVNKKDATGNAPIHQAAQYGQAEVLKILLAFDGIDINVETRSGRTPLHIAASKGYLEIVQLLLDQEPSIVNSHTALHAAAARGRTNVVRYLLSLDNIDVNSPRYGWRPLHLAAENGHSEVVKLLLDSNHINTRCQDILGQSPLHKAAFNGKWETVHILLEHWEQSNDHGSPPNQESLQRDIDRTEVITRLLAHPDFLDVNMRERWRKEALLHKAVRKGECDIIRVLLAHKDIKVNLGNYFGESPLIVAAENGKLDAGKLLLEHKDIDIDIEVRWSDRYQRHRNMNALQVARKYLHKEFADLLLSYGATDDEVSTSTTVRQDTNMADTTRPGDAHSGPELADQPYLFIDEYMDDDPMENFDMSDTMDAETAA